MPQSRSLLVSLTISAFLAGAGAAAFVTVNVHTQEPIPAPVYETPKIDMKELAREFAAEKHRLELADANAARSVANTRYNHFMGR